MAAFVEKVPQTPPIRAALYQESVDVLNRNVKVNGNLLSGAHNAYVNREFATPSPAHQGIPGFLNAHPGAVLQVFDPDPLTVLGFATVTTAAQAKTLANALKPLVIAHLADGTYAHLAPDTTSAALVAADAADAGIATDIGAAGAGVKYTAALAGVTVRHNASGLTRALGIDVNGLAITVNLAGTGTNVAFGAGNSGILVKANRTGVTLELVDPVGATPDTLVAVVGNAITVTLKDPTGAAVTETALGLAAAILDEPLAAALLTSIAQAGDGSGTVAGAVLTALTWAQTSTANEVRLAVLASAPAMALLAAVINTSDPGAGIVLNAAATPLTVNATLSTSTLLNAIKATVHSHFARVPEHNQLPVPVQAIAAADGVDDATNITLADELMKDWFKHATQAILSLELDPRSP